MKTVTPEQAKQRIEAKSRLTLEQYFGGPCLTPKDHAVVSDVLLLVLGDLSFEVPPVCTAQWGFQAWAKYMTGGDW